jgi:hypothetical protein
MKDLEVVVAEIQGVCDALQLSKHNLAFAEVASIVYVRTVEENLDSLGVNTHDKLKLYHDETLRQHGFKYDNVVEKLYYQDYLFGKRN